MPPNRAITPETALHTMMVRASALRNHVPASDVEDYAIAFLEHVLQENTKSQMTLTPRSLTYWRKAADNWMKNALRDDLRRRRGQIAWPKAENEDGQTVSFDPPDNHPGPDGEAFRGELNGLLAKGMEELTAEQKEFLIRHIANGETYKVIAAETGRTPDAVRMIVTRALAHLRSTLKRHGFDEKEAAEYLAMMSPLPPANVAFPTTLPS